MKLYWKCMISCAIYSLVSTDFVTIDQGILFGTELRARHGTVYKAYFKIPFAQPPIGKLRFQPPKEAEGWQGIRDASIPTSEFDGCIQAYSEKLPYNGTEDCLYLNVFTPQAVKKGDNMPVILFIHGGNFVTGNVMKYSSEYMMDQQVVLVQTSFRLGLLGMFSTGDAIVPGNMALKDQSMALKWIRKNIYNFGGDPNRITLQGHSSGAVNCQLHTFSPMSKGLIRGIIIMSPMGGWTTIQKQERAKSYSREIAQIGGCPKYTSSREIFDCISKKSTQELVNIVADMKMSFGNVNFLTPVLEDANSNNGFLTEMWWNQSPQPTNISWLIGGTNSENGENVAKLLGKSNEKLEYVDQQYLKTFPMIMNYFINTKPNSLNYVTNILRRYYLGDEEITIKTAEQLCQMSSDVLMTNPTISSIHSFGGTKYVYLYNYRSNYSRQLELTNYKQYLGPSHTDDLLLVYKMEDSNDKLSPRDILFGDEIIKRHVNFAYSGNPNEPFPINESLFGYWDPSNDSDIDYIFMDIGGGMKRGLKTQQYKFLSSLPLFNILKDSS